MGKLSGTRVYLAGSIDQSKDLGRGWRKNITPFLQNMEIIVLDPCNKPISVGDETRKFHDMMTECKEKEEYDEVSQIMKKIRAIDLRMTDISDFIVAYLDTSVFNCGTLEEIFWANRLKRPILIVCSSGKRNCPNWLFGTVPHQHIFSSFHELCNYIKEINEDGPSKDDKRWILFNYQKMSKSNKNKMEKKNNEKDYKNGGYLTIPSSIFSFFSNMFCRNSS